MTSRSLRRSTTGGKIDFKGSQFEREIILWGVIRPFSYGGGAATRPRNAAAFRPASRPQREFSRHFVGKYAAKLGKRIETVTPETLALLKNYSWPGNVRELDHIIERTVIVTQGPTLAFGDWLREPGGPSSATSFPTLDEAERLHILKALEASGWRVSGEQGAAEILGVPPRPRTTASTGWGSPAPPEYSGALPNIRESRPGGPPESLIRALCYSGIAKKQTPIQ